MPFHLVTVTPTVLCHTAELLYDSKKAFNSVGHLILLQILRSFNFSDQAIWFLCHYLTHRSMITQGAGPCDYTCGVGQGSRPGGNLFLAFINSIFTAFMYLLVLLFVDDAQGFLHCFPDQINQAIQKTNADSQTLVDWTRAHGLSLNPSKTMAIIIGFRLNLRKIDELTLQSIIVDGQVIPLIDCVKSLGLTISSDVRWNQHVSDIVSSTNRILYFLNNNARDLPVKLKKLIAAQLLFARFDYACTVYIDLTRDLESRLEGQLNKFVFGLSRRSPTSSYRHKLR